MAIALGFDHMSAAVAIGRSPRPTVGAPHLRLATTERIGGLRPTRSAHPRAGRRHISPILASAVQAGATVLVLGATGGVGQIVTAKLIDRGYNVRAATRSAEKAAKLFGNTVEVVVGDTRDPDTLDNLLQGVDAVACCTGTTAFPSKRWDGGNGPEQTDLVGTRNLVEAAQRMHPRPGRVLLVSSVGVDRYNSFPFAILNAFGVLKFKKMGEDLLRSSGLPFTIIRPGRLTDGPYTSYDLNTLLKAASGTRQDVELSPLDELNGEASRIAAAECLVQALASSTAEGMVMSLTSKEGEGPGQDPSAWEELFLSVKSKSSPDM